MKAVAALLALAAPAAAFVPVAPSALPATQLAAAKQTMSEVSSGDDERSVSLPFAAKPANLNGELVGDVGFDPLRFSDKGDLAKFRRAELKHGRVAMLGVLGSILQESYSVQGPDFKTTKNLFAAVTDAGPLALLQVFAFVGAYDVATTKWEEANGRVPGDIGFDPLRLSKDGINETWALSELKHGRLAMIAMFAFLIQTLVEPNKSILEQTFDWARSFG
ncbi:light harvesting complex protein [Tribonema minus]|uniref:Light harvesting complex protein n=1 Tax=Tribonema minus TaxID=303371 RepID=A0A835YVN7_9STRA|nr:light harvesting complex protein [Tribonema minus]